MKNIIKKRLGIMAIFSDGEELEPATSYLIQNVAHIVNELCVVINGRLGDEALKKLERIVSMVYIRENHGYDSAAFKCGLEDVVGWEKVQKYDELLLLNDSCFGPIYPFEEMFQHMEEKECDFWGVTEQPEIKRGKYIEATYPHHIQSYFLVIKERMLKSQEFVKYWEDIRLTDNYELTVDNFELTFTKYFKEHGYIPQAYVDASAFCDSVEETQAYVFFDSYRLIKNYRCPLLKKKVFLFSEQDVLAANAGETAKKTLEYVGENTNYDVDMIWDYLIKKSDLYELKSVLHLTYICSKKILTSADKKEKKVAVLLLASTETMVEQFQKYVKDIGEEIAFYVILGNCTESERAENLYKKLIQEYEYLCVINEGDKSVDNEVRELYIQSLLENSIANRIYIENVLQLFIENEKMGVLALPKPYFGNMFMEGFENNLANGFWARTASLDASESIEYNVKKKGFFIGEVFTEECANYFISDYANILNELIRNQALCHGVEEFRYLFCINKKILEFIKNYRKIYVYGAGEFGGACIQYLEEYGVGIDGVLVSDGRTYSGAFLGYPMYGYEDVKIELGKDTGIIVAMNEKNTQIINEMLVKDGFTGYINFSE